MKNKFIFLIITIAVWSCKKHQTVTPAPGTAAYLKPTPNAPCIPSGFVNDSTGNVDFQWKQASNTWQYIITITNLLTRKAIADTTANLYLTLPLRLATPYSWSITSLQAATGAKTTSATWKFYVAGSGRTTYAPYPAAIVSPAFGVEVPAGSVNLTWTGSDMQAEKLTYSVYLDTITSPALLKAGIADMFLNNVSILAGKTYYWRVITLDESGNSSDSGLYQFSSN
jgi:hypothetical protein